ncbi:BREX system serine/threonine kinase PglW [Cellulomonas fimi]|uniref:non-specific serine/threonine protein kinase n=1 Tax=Cellulomonas fimi TaxID=1708 RepID=A0A7Y0QHG6_CELFI|nr:BREX system serine/threonine kinase PglW [Cellulomonas fimi]NMR20265.1 BREX system serine/threonine kinase PglW [Cellulomonas fimi]
MKSTSHQWKKLGEPASTDEALALDAIRALLPDDAVTHAWTNLTFVDLDGRTAEVDLLLMSKVGFFVVELKGWHGRVAGDQQNWRHTQPNGHVRNERNPLFATDGKAKRLRSLLERMAPNEQVRRTVPFVEPLVVLHGKGSTVELDQTAQASVVALDGYGVTGLTRSLSDVLDTPPTNAQRVIDGPRATKIRTLLDHHAGFRPTPKNRYIGDYSLDKADPLDDGPAWQDLLAAHPAAPAVKRRIRLFDLKPGASAEARAEIERAARREFLFTQGIQHSGIACPKELVESGLGPALIYDHSDSEVPLDAYLADAGATLGLGDRLDLVRRLADILRYAHQRRLVHRALTPRQVYVNTAAKPPELVVRDWQSGRRNPAASSAAGGGAPQSATSFGTADVRGLIAQRDWVYLAPETHRGADDLPPIPLDVYGLGALSYLVLTGEPPAATLAELQQRLDADGALDPQLADPALDDVVADLVRRATTRVEADRIASVEEFLAGLDDVEDALTSPDQDAPVDERPRAQDPLEARRGDTIADRFIVREERGQGSTGVALLVEDTEPVREGVILKIARDDSAARRLAEEAAVLAQLEHPRLVRLLAPPLDVDGRTALLLSDAGKETLATRIKDRGRATLQELERFGADLMEAVAYLDSRGFFHRDIKPANLGIQADPGTRRPRLVLFDFSLAREPLENLGSGTRGYLDPYIAVSRSSRGRARRRYDRAAELYAVAATLFEMAATDLPWWVDGELAPASMTDRVVITPEMFEASVAAPLSGFFAQALAPDVADRFADVAAMAQAWHRLFAAIDSPSDELDDAARDAAAEAATLGTALTESGLSARALSALSRVPAQTVGDLLRTSPMQINAIAGMGEQHRKEIQRRIRRWRSRLLAVATTTDHAEPVGADRSVETFLARLLPRSTSADRAEVDALRALLGMTDDGDAAVLGSNLWPSAAEVAAATGRTRADVTDALEKAAGRWQRSSVVREVRAEVDAALAAEEGVAALPELAGAVLLRHGSTAEGSVRLRRAAGLVRAVVESDRQSKEPGLAFRRVPGGAVVVATAPGGDVAAAEALLDDAATLAATAAALTAERAVVPASVARAALRSQPLLRAELSDDRVLRLAAASAGSVQLSSFHELYRPDLDLTEAAAVALRGAAVTVLTEAGVRKRVGHRFPALPALPPRPALDQVVTAAVPGMRWEGDHYERTSHGSSRLSTTSRTHVPAEAPDVADSLLRSSLRRSSALTLCVPPRSYERATSTLAHLYGVQPVDVAAELLTAVRALAGRDGVDWQLVLRTDAEPGSGGDWDNLVGLVTDAMAEPWKRLVATPRPLLLLNAAPLTRYGMTALVSDLLDQSQPRPAARWLLVPRHGRQPFPMLDSRPVPLGADRWIDLPEDLSALRPAPGVPA